MTHDRTYYSIRHSPAPRLRDTDGSTRPHTYGVRPWSCPAIATKPCRPMACVGKWAHHVLRPTANYSLLTANSSFTFSAKERDPETGLSYFGSRYYSSDLSIWLSVDPMASKYPSLSPYVYCADNPVFFKDPNGDSVAVLLAKSSPIVGHMAILIQIHGGENDGKWALWSKNGENKTWSQSVVDLSDDKGVRVWNSPQEFLNMNDEKYEDAYVIPTTNEQDKQITEGFRKSQEINYLSFASSIRELY